MDAILGLIQFSHPSEFQSHWERQVQLLAFSVEGHSERGYFWSDAKEAIGILKKRFGNRQQIISRHMDILMNVEQITSHSNVKGLRQLYDVVESNVRSLDALGVAADSYGCLLALIYEKTAK